MLERISFWLFQLRIIGLILLSILFLPFSTFVLALSYALRPFSSVNSSRRRIRRRFSFQPKTIMVTGIGTAKGLFLARKFYEAGHDVIGADFGPYGVSVGGRFSSSLRKFYSLARPSPKDDFTFFLPDLLGIIQREKVDLWVNCSGVASAVEDAQAKEIIERRSDCVAIQFDVATTSALHEKLTFIQRARELDLPVPETYEVTSRTAVHKILHSPAASKKKYVMKRHGVDPAIQADKTLLPRRTTSETYNHVSVIPISSSNPWVLQEYIRGQKYCTYALVINNVVKAFAACLSAENKMHYEALPRSALNLAMQRFTQEFARRSPPGMTGHLNFEFMVQEVVSERGLELTLRALSCNPRTHTAVMLLSNQGQSQALAEAYLSALRRRDYQMNGSPAEQKSRLPPEHNEPITTPDAEVLPDPALPDPNIITPPPARPPKYYWIGHDILTLLFLPLFTRPFSISTYAHNVMTLLLHLFFWNEAIFAIWDPLPWWWFYHVYWPRVFLKAMWTGRKWRRVDVGTGEVF